MAKLGLTLDPKLHAPMYQQIFDQIAQRVRTGAFPAGYRLPPTRDLAQQLKTHRNTVIHAYADLEAAGFVNSTVGRGTFVQKHSPEERGIERPAATGAIAWSNVLSRAARSEPLRRMDRYRELRPSRDVIKLGRMQPSADLIPDALMGRCLEHVMKRASNLMAYAPTEGLLSLREQVTKDLNSRGVPASTEHIVITSGSQQALDIAVRSIANPGDKILVDGTTYGGLIELLAISGVQPIPVPRDEHGPDLEALARLSHGDVKGFYLMPNGHNPTGLTISTERRHGLIAWSRASSIPLIEDDFAAGLGLDESIDVAPYLRALDGDVIHISTFSKRLIPALRIGYVVCPPRIFGAIRSMKRAMDLSSSTIMQAALAEFIDRGYLRAHMQRVTAEYRARRDALELALRRHLPKDVRWTSPNHGLALWLRLPPTLDPDLLFEEAWRQGVQVSPSAMWSVHEAVEAGVRLTFCSEPIPRLEEGAKRLGKAMKLIRRAVPHPISSDAIELA